MATLGTGQLTAIDVSPTEYIAIAAEQGLDTVSLFINPMGTLSGDCITTTETSAAVKEQLRATGMTVANVECFPIFPGLDVESYRSAIALGADLGAKSATVIIYDQDAANVVDSLSKMCDLTAEFGMRVGIEFMPLALGWKTLPETVELVKQVAKPNLGIGVDLLHLIRSGGTPDDVAATNPDYIAYAQLCDSLNLDATEDYVEEASVQRLAPGEGKFPMQEFLKALPAGTPLELEVPQQSDTPAGERMKAIVAAARREIKLAGV